MNFTIFYLNLSKDINPTLEVSKALNKFLIDMPGVFFLSRDNILFTFYYDNFLKGYNFLSL